MVEKAVLYATLVSGTSIFQPEWHGDVTVRAKQGDERGRELVGFFYRDVVIARVSIQKG